MRIADRLYINLHGEDNAVEQDFVFCSSADSRAYNSSEDTDRTDRLPFVCDAPLLQDGTDGVDRSASNTALNQPCHGSP